MDSSRKLWLLPVFRQSGVASSIFFNKFGQGMVSGILSGMIANMLVKDADFRINMAIASTLGPMVGIGSMLTLPVGAYLMNKIGRKITFLLTNIPAVIGMLMNAYAYNVPVLLLGRFLCGITIGCTGSLAPMIIGEYTSPQFRGIFLMLKTSFFNLGILLAHLLSYYMHWRKVSFVAAASFAISVIITFIWHESPYWLAEKKKMKESEAAFYWLRGKNQDSTREFDEIVKNQGNKNFKKTFCEAFGEFFMKLKKKNFWKPFVIVALTSIMLECSAMHIFSVYAILIVKDMTSNSVDSFYYDMALVSIITVSSFFSAYLVKVFKLRPLLFTTGFIAVADLYITSLFLYLTSNGTLSKEYSWIPISLLGLFFIVVNLACTLVPITIAGEIFPSEHRAVGAAVSGYFICLSLIVSLKVTPFLVQNFKTQGTFTLLASGLLLSLVGLYVLLPETKNKTLQEIDDFFIYGHRRKILPQYDNDHNESKELMDVSK